MVCTIADGFASHIRLPEGGRLVLEAKAGRLELTVDGRLECQLTCVAQSANTLRIGFADPQVADTRVINGVYGTLYSLFSGDASLREVEWVLPAHRQLDGLLWREGLTVAVERTAETHVARIPRALFWQRRAAFLAASAPLPEVFTMTAGKRHPVRPPHPEGTFYRRYIPELSSTIAFHTIDPSRDLRVFNTWMNDPRVSAFWEMPGSESEHAKYIADMLADPRVHPVVGTFDEQPFGYYELYWAKEDRIAPYYDVDDYDRGLHMLVGEQRFRGPARVRAWLRSLVHYLFLDDPRTRRVVAEPRADNQKMIDYLCGSAGFYVEKQFDFPHKRAAMAIVPRETFFAQFGP
ncbi:MAG: GNAT family N-acetyltransferase [Polyangiales bacterium]